MLKDIIDEDPRMQIKYLCLKELCSCIINPRSKNVHIKKLQSLLHYMMLYDWCLDLQSFGISVLCDILNARNGLSIVEEVMSSSLREHFDKLVRFKYLVAEITHFMSLLDAKRSEIAIVLVSMKKNKTEQNTKCT